MLQPKRTKYRKAQKGKMKGLSQRGHRLSNGMFGIKSLESKFLTSRQIEAARIAATRYMKSCLLYTSPSPRDVEESRMPSSA